MPKTKDTLSLIMQQYMMRHVNAADTAEAILALHSKLPSSEATDLLHALSAQWQAIKPVMERPYFRPFEHFLNMGFQLQLPEAQLEPHVLGKQVDYVNQLLKRHCITHARTTSNETLHALAHGFVIQATLQFVMAQQQAITSVDLFHPQGKYAEYTFKKLVQGDAQYDRTQLEPYYKDCQYYQDTDGKRRFLRLPLTSTESDAADDLLNQTTFRQHWQTFHAHIQTLLQPAAADKQLAQLKSALQKKLDIPSQNDATSNTKDYLYGAPTRPVHTLTNANYYPADQQMAAFNAPMQAALRYDEDHNFADSIVVRGDTFALATSEAIAESPLEKLACQRVTKYAAKHLSRLAAADELHTPSCLYDIVHQLFTGTTLEVASKIHHIMDIRDFKQHVGACVTRLYQYKDTPNDCVTAVTAATGNVMVLAWDPKAKKLHYLAKAKQHIDSNTFHSIHQETDQHSLQKNVCVLPQHAIIFQLSESAWRNLPGLQHTEKDNYREFHFDEIELCNKLSEIDATDAQAFINELVGLIEKSSESNNAYNINARMARLCPPDKQSMLNTFDHEVAKQHQQHRNHAHPYQRLKRYSKTTISTATLVLRGWLRDIERNNPSASNDELLFLLKSHCLATLKSSLLKRILRNDTKTILLKIYELSDLYNFSKGSVTHSRWASAFIAEMNRFFAHDPLALSFKQMQIFITADLPEKCFQRYWNNARLAFSSNSNIVPIERFLSVHVHSNGKLAALYFYFRALYAYQKALLKARTEQSQEVAIFTQLTNDFQALATTAYAPAQELWQDIVERSQRQESAADKIARYNLIGELIKEHEEAEQPWSVGPRLLLTLSADPDVCYHRFGSQIQNLKPNAPFFQLRCYLAREEQLVARLPLLEQTICMPAIEQGHTKIFEICGQLQENTENQQKSLAFFRNEACPSFSAHLALWFYEHLHLNELALKFARHAVACASDLLGLHVINRLINFSEEANEILLRLADDINRLCAMAAEHCHGSAHENYVQALQLQHCVEPAQLEQSNELARNAAARHYAPANYLLAMTLLKFAPDHFDTWYLIYENLVTADKAGYIPASLALANFFDEQADPATRGFLEKRFNKTGHSCRLFMLTGDFSQPGRRTYLQHAQTLFPVEPQIEGISRQIKAIEEEHTASLLQESRTQIQN